MKICHILWGLSYGGIETMIVNIANFQANDNHNVSIMVINDIVDETLIKKINPKVNVRFIKRPVGSKNPYYSLKANVLLIKEKPDIVHFHRLDQKRFFIRPILEKHCVTVHIDWLPYMENFIHSYQNIFAISKYVKDSIEKNSHVSSALVYNGINVDEFHQKTHWFEKGKRSFRILQLGRIDFSHKGQDVFVEALEILNSKNIDFVADIIGNGKDFQFLQELVDKKGLTDKIKLLGLKDQDYLKKHLRDYDLLVHPSKHEGFGLVITEAMASKVPVLVSDVPAQLEIIDNGRYGYVFKSECPLSMAEALFKIIDNYDVEMTNRAYCQVKNMFNICLTAKQYLQEYVSILGD